MISTLFQPQPMISPISTLDCALSPYLNPAKSRDFNPISTPTHDINRVATLDCQGFHPQKAYDPPPPLRCAPALRFGSRKDFCFNEDDPALLTSQVPAELMRCTEAGCRGPGPGGKAALVGTCGDPSIVMLIGTNTS